MPIFEEFKGRTAIVTGAGRGIGRGIAQRLDELGATVYAVSIDSNELAELKFQRPNIQTVAVDLGDWKATRAAIESFPVADYLVNNAGVLVTKRFREASEQDLDNTFNVNVKAIFNVSQVFVSKLIAAGKPGSIVNISSIAGTRPSPVSPAYGASKAAIDHLTRNMALELAPLKIRVNAVSPGSVRTEMYRQAVEASRAQNPDVNLETTFSQLPLEAKESPMGDIVNAVLFMLSNSAASTATGSNFLVDCGYCLV